MESITTSPTSFLTDLFWAANNTQKEMEQPETVSAFDIFLLVAGLSIPTFSAILMIFWAFWYFNNRFQKFLKNKFEFFRILSNFESEPLRDPFQI